MLPKLEKIKPTYWFDKEYKIFFLWTLLLLYYWFVNLFLLC